MVMWENLQNGQRIRSSIFDIFLSWMGGTVLLLRACQFAWNAVVHETSWKYIGVVYSTPSSVLTVPFKTNPEHTAKVSPLLLFVILLFGFSFCYCSFVVVATTES
jgi:hypothetical protein